MHNVPLKWKDRLNVIDTEHEENMRVRRTEEMRRESRGVIRIFWHRTCWEHAAYSCQCSQQENGVSSSVCPFQCSVHVPAQNRRWTWFHFWRFSFHVLRSEHWVAPAVYTATSRCVHERRSQNKLWQARRCDWSVMSEYVDKNTSWRGVEPRFRAHLYRWQARVLTDILPGIDRRCSVKVQNVIGTTSCPGAASLWYSPVAARSHFLCDANRLPLQRQTVLYW